MAGKFQHVFLICGILVYLVLTYMTIVLGDYTVNFFTAEDGLFESLTALYFFLSSLFFLMAYDFSQRITSYSKDHSKKHIFYLLLAGVFFVGCMEEISWGQRILNLQTPESFSQYNRQHEVNIHNLMWFHGDVDGQRKNFLELFLNIDRLFSLFWMSWCIIIPIFYAYSAKVRYFLESIGMPIVSLSVGFFFLLNYLISKGVENFLPEFSHAAVEIKEHNSALLFVFVALLELFKFVPAFSESPTPNQEIR